jgi:hypothetical protein
MEGRKQKHGMEKGKEEEDRGGIVKRSESIGERKEKHFSTSLVTA